MLKSYAKTNDEIANENTSLSSYQKLRHGLIYSSQDSFCTTFIKAFQISFQVLNGRNRGQLFLPIAYDAYLFNCKVNCVSLYLVHSVFKSYPFGVPLSRVKSRKSRRHRSYCCPLVFGARGPPLRFLVPTIGNRIVFYWSRFNEQSNSTTMLQKSKQY